MKNKIGLFVRDNFCGHETDDFKLIVGIDVYEGNLITAKKNKYGYSYESVDPNAETYSVDEAVEYLNARIKTVEAEIAKLLAFYPEYIKILSTIERENEKNEFSHLYSAYLNTKYQLEVVEGCAKSQCLSDKVKAMYQKEIIAARRGIRRMEKRFYHYFKDNAQTVIDIISNHSSHANILDGVKQKERTVMNLKKSIEYVKEEAARERKG